MSKSDQRAGAIKQHLNPSTVKSELEQSLVEAVKKGDLPQAVIYATDKSGSFSYKFSHGAVSVDKDARPIKEDDLFLLASQTKLITSIAILQAAEKGLLTLDDDITDVLPELAKQPILKGWDDDDEPILAERKDPITLRLLLTHSVGCAYDAAEPLIMTWQAYKDRRISRGATVTERYDYPLLFEPGTAWVYGSNMDWAGLYLERVAKTTLEDWFQAHIFKPLGINDTTFWPDKHPHLRGRDLKIAFREDDGVFTVYNGQGANDGSTACFGGHGLYGTIGSYTKVLQSILRDDGKLLKPTSVLQMFTPQLDEGREKALKVVMNGPAGVFFVGEYNMAIRMNWGIGGALFLDDDEGKRKKGTMQWSGMANTFWILDPKAGIALTFGTQVLMPGDRIVAKHISNIERAVYKMAGVTV